MAARKTIKTKSGTKRSASAGAIQEPANTQHMLAAIEQLAESLNELIVRFNAHTHGGVTVGAGSTGVSSSLVNGTAQADASLFTP